MEPNCYDSELCLVSGHPACIHGRAVDHLTGPTSYALLGTGFLTELLTGLRRRPFLGSGPHQSMWGSAAW